MTTIQRIGRCLRTDPKNKDKIAHVIDLVLDYDVMTGKKDSEVTSDSFLPPADWIRYTWLKELSEVRPKK